MTSTGILVIYRRYLCNTKSIRYLNIQSNLDTPINELLCKYRGIEGEVWPDSPVLDKVILNKYGFAPVDQLSTINEYLYDINRNCVDVIVVEPIMTEYNSNILTSNYQLGFDCGYCNNYGSVYSIIFNEIVFGDYAGLTKYANKLNSHILLNSLEDARHILSKRKDMIADGCDLESYPSTDAMMVFKISKFVQEISDQAK